MGNHTFVTVNTQQNANDELFVAFIPCMQDMKLGVVLLPAGLKSADTMRVFCEEEEEEEEEEESSHIFQTTQG